MTYPHEYDDDLEDDCGLHPENGEWQCAADGTEYCSFLCPFHDQVGTKVGEEEQ